MTPETRQRLDELATEWRSSGSIQKGVTKAVYAAYEMGLLASRNAALEEAARQLDSYIILEAEAALRECMAHADAMCADLDNGQNFGAYQITVEAFREWRASYE